MCAIGSSAPNAARCSDGGAPNGWRDVNAGDNGAHVSTPLGGFTPYESAVRMGRRMMRDEMLQTLSACMAGESDPVARDAVWRAIDRAQRITL